MTPGDVGELTVAISQELAIGPLEAILSSHLLLSVTYCGQYAFHIRGADDLVSTSYFV